MNFTYFFMNFFYFIDYEWNAYIVIPFRFIRAPLKSTFESSKYVWWLFLNAYNYVETSGVRRYQSILCCILSYWQVLSTLFHFE